MMELNRDNIMELNSTKNLCDITMIYMPWDLSPMGPLTLKAELWPGPLGVSAGASFLANQGDHSFGFNTSKKDLGSAESFHQGTGLRVLSLELATETRGQLEPDPQQDQILLIYLSVVTDCPGAEKAATHLMLLNPPFMKADLTPMRRMAEGFHLAPLEEYLLQDLILLIRKEDPDVLLGYEVQRSSWGYLLERGQKLGLDMGPLISRVPEWERGSGWSKEEHWWSMAEITISGRIVLNLWRLLRHEAALTSYTLQSAAWNLLHTRLPKFTPWQLSAWLDDPFNFGRAVDYVRVRAQISLDLLKACDLLNRTTEMARVYGIQFFEVLSRGSQFRVESMLLRMTREQGYAAPSPSPALRNRMAAPECIALTLEPHSGLYREPVIVLDFQSLYPSVVIAHNYCYSTCLGKLRLFSKDPTKFKLGCLQHSLGEDEMRGLGPDDVHFSPAGVGFVKAHVRRGVMPSMLEEILATRLMVKGAMKRADDKNLHRLLDARQLALKLIANVTYGYTSANFSGRMPCVEVADSIVHKGREALEDAIQFVSNEPRWAPLQVVYGDTDSLFIKLPGRSKAKAFEIGAEIAAAVTARHPKPMKLKFEKVFYPCLLQTKKRYVGYAWESPEQAQPIFDAKGIETVRRDSIPLVGKLLEKTLRAVFECRNIETVRRQVVRALGRVSLPEFVFAREFRGLEGYRPTAVVPALKIARERLQRDPRSAPLMSQRVEYVIGSGPPAASLFSCVKEPDAFIKDPTLRLNLAYYLKGVLLPPLKRVLELVPGADPDAWLALAIRTHPPPVASAGRAESSGPKRTLSQYYAPANCLVCRTVTLQGAICPACVADSSGHLVAVTHRAAEAEARLVRLQRLCDACARTPYPGQASSACVNFPCPILHKRLWLSESLQAQRKAIVALSRL